MALINRRLGDVYVARNDRTAANRRFAISAAYYDTLLSRGAGNRSDSSDARAVREALARRTVHQPSASASLGRR
jgi:hypothetical protein